MADSRQGSAAAIRIDPARYGDTVAEIFDEHLALTDTEATVEFLASLLPPNGSALEVGVGTGRVALPLAERGFVVTGVEASARMVERLRRKPGGQGLRVIEGDFLGQAAVRGQFELVYLLDRTFNALGTQDRQIEFLCRSAALLGRGGHVVIHSMMPPLDSLHKARVGFAADHSGGLLYAFRFSHDVVTQVLSGTASWVLADGRRYDLPAVTRYCWPAELTLMGRTAGLSSASLHGGWDRSTLTGAANAMVAVFARPDRHAPDNK